MINDLRLILQAYLLLWIWQIGGYIWIRKVLGDLLDKGWAIGRFLFGIIVAFIIWTLANMKLPVNTTAMVWLLTGLILLVGMVRSKLFKPTEIRKLLNEIKGTGKYILIEELLFLGGFIAYAVVRAYQPNILGLEKYMDFGFINSYLNSVKLPAPDMWMAGKSINYYSFGHFWASIVIRFWGIVPQVGYNLMLALLLAFGLIISFSVIVNLSNNSKKIVGGVIGSLMVVLAGNSHTISTLLTKGNLTGYWYADATRFIDKTIHEFPAYSFVVSDLHAHILGLPVVLAFVLIMILWLKARSNFRIDLFLGLLLGVMAMTNTWDVATYGLLLLITGTIKYFLTDSGVYMISISYIRILLMAILTSFIWSTNFVSISNGIGIVTSRSPLWQILFLWVGHLILLGLGVLMNLKQKKQRNMLVMALSISALLLIIIPELVYAKDIYLTHPRANTMFKLTFQALIMMSLVGGWVVNQLFELKTRSVRVAGMLIVLTIFAGLMIFPFEAYGNYYNDLKSYQGLDGTRYLNISDPNEVEIIDYLTKHRNSMNIVEATGDSFTDFDTISAYTGIPTVIGWRAHEWLWRGSYEPIGIREGEVTELYQNSNPERTKEIIGQYNIGWIVITRHEYEKYQVDVEGLKLFGKVVWTKDREMLIRVN